MWRLESGDRRLRCSCATRLRRVIAAAAWRTPYALHPARCRLLFSLDTRPQPLCLPGRFSSFHATRCVSTYIGASSNAAELTRVHLTQDIEAKVAAEANKVFGDEKKVPHREAVDEMDYTLATLKESLRLYSVVPVVTRVAVVCGPSRRP